MKKYKLFTIYVLGSLYIYVGISHFISPEYFKIIMPDYIPFHYIFIYVSGLFEIIFGFMIFFRKTRFYGAWGIFSLLILVYPANIYLYESTEIQEILSVSKDQTFIRLLFQFPLILLSFWHTRDFNSKIFNIFCSVMFVPTLIYFLTL